MIPVVFISYSHDSPEHKAWVKRLAEGLRAKGVEVILDQWDLAMGQDVPSFMNDSLMRADRVLLVCTEDYVEKATKGTTGGVPYERLIITQELVSMIDTKKFIPVMRQKISPPRKVVFLGERRYADFSDDRLYDEALDLLLRDIHGVSDKPALGPNPFATDLMRSADTLSTPPRVQKPQFGSATAPGTLDAPWFEEQSARATNAMEALALAGSMEFRATVAGPLETSQAAILRAVRAGEIRTFGWPIALVLDRDGYRPRPTAQGIEAEIAIEDGKGFGSSSASYDFWAARSNGDFFLRQSLFEDEREPGAIFFNTRIVRVAESLLFLAGYYEALGVPPTSMVHVRFRHTGLAGRKLTSAGNSRFLSLARGTDVPEVAKELDESVQGLRENTAANVQRLLAPLFMVFDFMEFADKVYQEVVDRFKAGEVS